MEAFISFMDTVLVFIVEISTTVLELFGICILVYNAVRCFLGWIRHESGIRLKLAQGIALALEFKMGGEVLRTVVVREWAELGILGAIIVLRGALTFLIHWEIKNEEKALEKKDLKKKQTVRRKKAAEEEDLQDTVRTGDM
jgi:uncharacterized membrane protein